MGEPTEEPNPRDHVDKNLGPSTVVARGDTAERPGWQRNMGSFRRVAGQEAVED